MRKRLLISRYGICWVNIAICQSIHCWVDAKAIRPFCITAFLTIRRKQWWNRSNKKERTEFDDFRSRSVPTRKPTLNDCVEDTVGCELSNAAVAHLALSLPENFIYACYQAPDYGVRLGQTSTVIEHGDVRIGDEPGLGVQIDTEALGKPLDEWTM